MLIINSKTDLRNAILQLEFKQAEEEKLLKEQFLLTFESIRPINLIKGTLKNLASSPELIDNLLGTATGLATGYLSKKIVVGASGGFVRNFIGSLLQVGVTSLVSQHTGGIRSLGSLILRRVLRKKEPDSEDQSV